MYVPYITGDFVLARPSSPPTAIAYLLRKRLVIPPPLPAAPAARIRVTPYDREGCMHA